MQDIFKLGCTPQDLSDEACLPADTWSGGIADIEQGIVVPQAVRA